jgi:hypothetical protein
MTTIILQNQPIRMHGSCVMEGGALNIESWITQATDKIWTSYFTPNISIYGTNYVQKGSSIRPLLGTQPPGHSQKGNKMNLDSESHWTGPKSNGCALVTRTTIILRNGVNWMHGSGGTWGGRALKKIRKLPLFNRWADRSEIMQLIYGYYDDHHIAKTANSDAWVLCNERGNSE